MDLLRRILSLVRSTKKECVFTDRQGDAYVLMPLDLYERLTNRDEVLEGANREIATWREASVTGDGADAVVDDWRDDFGEYMEEEERRYYFDPDEESLL